MKKIYYWIVVKFTPQGHHKQNNFENMLLWECHLCRREYIKCCIKSVVNFLSYMYFSIKMLFSSIATIKTDIYFFH